MFSGLSLLVRRVLSINSFDIMLMVDKNIIKFLCIMASVFMF